MEIQWVKQSVRGNSFINNLTLNATKLVLGNNTDYSGSATTVQRTDGSKRRLELSTAQTGMDSKVSSIILLEGNDATERATCKAYLEKRWRNQTTTPQVDPNAVSSTWLAELRYSK